MKNKIRGALLLVGAACCVGGLSACGTESSSSSLPVEKAACKIEVDGDYLVEVGKTAQLQTTVYGPDCEVSYFVSDPDLASVSSTGLVTTKKAGFVTVTATASSERSDPVSDSFAFFVEPTYFARFVDSVSTSSIDKGIHYSGNLKFCFSPSTSDGEEQENMTMVLPYELSLYKDPTEGVQMDFHADLGANTSLVSLALSVLGGTSGLGNSTRLGFTYFGGSDISLYGASGEAHDTICYYKRVSLTNELLPAVTSGLTSLLSSGGSSFITEDMIKDFMNRGFDALDIPSYSGLINTALTYSEDPLEGIFIGSEYLLTAQTYLNKWREKAVNAVLEKYDGQMMAEIYANMVKSIFPESLQDARFVFNMKENGTFDSVNLIIKDKKEDIVYKYLNISFFNTNNSFDAQYLPALKASLEKAENEKGYLDATLALKEVVKQDLLHSSLIMDESKISDSTAADKSHSAYDAIHFSGSFVKDLKAYRTSVAALDDETSETYVSNQSWKSNASLDDYLPYAGYGVSLASDTELNLLPDKYKAKVGDEFLIHSFEASGSNDESIVIDDSSISFKFVNAKGKTYAATDYSYDSTTHILKVLALPTAADSLVIKSTSTGLKSLTFRLTLKAAA